MSRNPFDDPRSGDVIHHPKFGSGCRFSVVKTMMRHGWGKAVKVQIDPDSSSPIKRKLRLYGLSSWSTFQHDEGVSILHLAEDAPMTPEQAMTITRADVESLLATVEQIHKPNQGVIAELCRCWLAVDDAPSGLTLKNTGTTVHLQTMKYIPAGTYKLVCIDTPKK